MALHKIADYALINPMNHITAQETQSHTAGEQTLEQMVSLVREANIRHVAIIMDGNRRWAQQKHLPKLAGHGKGVEALQRIVRHAGKIGLEALTVYAFSTENWRRGEEEVGHLMKLFIEALSRELKSLHENNVQLHFIGDLSPLPPPLLALLEKAMAMTAENTGLKLQVATNYGSRAELVQACRRLAQDVQANRLAADALEESHLAQYLYTHPLPDPDLLIRTGGESRLSNYLLWQCAYTELFFLPTLWPDFNEHVLNQTLMAYGERERRFGQ